MNQADRSARRACVDKVVVGTDAIASNCSFVKKPAEISLSSPVRLEPDSSLQLIVTNSALEAS